MVGSAIVKQLTDAGFKNIIMRTHAELDLIDQAAVRAFMLEEKPQKVILAAAKVNKGVRPFFSKAYLHKQDICCYISKCLIYMGDYFMRTTIDIDDQLLLYAKHQAVKQGCTIKQILEDALRNFFSHPTSQHDFVSLETFSGAGLKPGVNLDNSRSLSDIMDDY